MKTDELLIYAITRLDQLLGALNRPEFDFWPLREAARRLGMSEERLKARLDAKGIGFGRGERATISNQVYLEILTDLQRAEQARRKGKRHGTGIGRQAGI